MGDYREGYGWGIAGIEVDGRDGDSWECASEGDSLHQKSERFFRKD